MEDYKRTKWAAYLVICLGVFLLGVYFTMIVQSHYLVNLTLVAWSGCGLLVIGEIILLVGWLRQRKSERPDIADRRQNRR